jgi:hypothetical protein
MSRSKLIKNNFFNFRQFFYDKNIPIFNSTKTDEIFMNNFLTISDKVQDMIQTTYSNTKYLTQDYMDKFMYDLNNNITSLINTTRIDIKMFLGTPNYVKLLILIILGIQSGYLKIFRTDKILGDFLL